MSHNRVLSLEVDKLADFNEIKSFRKPREDAFKKKRTGDFSSSPNGRVCKGYDLLFKIVELKKENVGDFEYWRPMDGPDKFFFFRK